ncbi:MAG TPA: hypothetical protein ENF52_05380, partial [Chloroflexi bacterium]|nr:hypothetical protein [Chloroflexota bacterium]
LFIHLRSWDVDLRYRGDTARLMPKKCWKAFFPASDMFQGQEELNLNADYVDQTLLRSYVGYDFFQRVGVPTPQAGYAALSINDDYYGLFSQVEQVDERFLYRLGIEPHGNLYKPWYGNLGALDFITDPDQRAWWYRYHYPKKTNRDTGMEDMIALIELINYTSDDHFPREIAAVLDVNEWLDWYAANILIGNFEMMEKNYYLYHDFSTDRWIILPWDVDLSLGHNAGAGGGGYGHLLDTDLSWDNPIDSGTHESKKVDGKWNILIDRMMAVPEFRQFHCRRLQEMMADEFSPDEIFPRIDVAFAAIRSWGERDSNRWQPEGFQFADGPDELKTYITNRIAFLQAAIPDFCPQIEVPLTINEAMALNAGTVTDEMGEAAPWFEIYNQSETLAWDLSGMYLSDVITAPTRWRIPDGVRIPPGEARLFWADGEPTEGLLHTSFTLSSTGGTIALFDRDIFGRRLLSVVTLTASSTLPITLMTDVSLGRWPDGDGTWQVLTTPTPGWPNRGRPPIITDVTHAPPWPDGGTPITIAAVVTDEISGNGEGGLLTVTLHYRTFPAGSTPPTLYQAMPMTPIGHSRWQAVYPPQVAGTWIEYDIEAIDAAGMTTVKRPGWPEGDYRIVVGWQPPSVVINELMAINANTVEDEAGETDDWIELYNPGPVDVDVGGMYLSDNFEQPTKYTIPTGAVVPAGGYLLLWADGDGNGLHLNFRLSGSGEYVGLFDRADRHYAPVDAVYFPPQTVDVSWGRFPDGSAGTWHAMDDSTPGKANRLRPPAYQAVERVPCWPQGNEPVTVTAVVTAGCPVVSATVWYDSGGGFRTAPMVTSSLSPNGEWSATLSPVPTGTLVSYYLEAVDCVGQRTRYPATAPAFTLRYEAGYTPPPLFINEFMAANGTTVVDEAGEYDDWLELYNAGSVTLTLDGFSLSDDLMTPEQWAFPLSTTIPPEGHLLVWCDRDGEQGPLHANFKLDRDGEEIGLFAPRAWG